jgi:hypothetical protein
MEAVGYAYADALNHFRVYARSPKARAADVQEAQAKWIPQMEAQAGELQIDGGEGSSVTVDGGDAIGLLPLGVPYAVVPGHHRVEGHLGAEVTSREVDVAAGQMVAVHLVGAAPAVASGVPIAPEGAAAPQVPQAVNAGDAGESTTRAAPLRTWMTVGLGVAAVGALAGGIGFGAASKSAGNDAQSIRTTLGGNVNACDGAGAAQCAQLKSDLDSQNHDHTLEIVFYAGAGAFAAGAVLSWFPLPKTVEPHSAIAPMIGPGVAGARWLTTF